MNTSSTLTGSYLITLTLIIALATTATAQTSPNMKFVRPVLSSGTAGQVGATYKFSNVISGVDAFVKIENIKNNAVLINIDDTTMGYYNSWQPIVGGPYNPGQTYEMRWGISFKNTNGTTHSFAKFDLAAIDIDGDGGKVREYVNVNGQLSYNVPTAIPTLMNFSSVSNSNYAGNGQDAAMDIKAVGPIAVRNGIDTVALDTRINYKFQNKDKIMVTTGTQIDNNSFVYGNVTVATSRYYSMYFKPVSNIIITGVLPVTMRVFDAVAVNNNSANLYWITDAEMANNHFEIERSYSQTDFRTIGMVLGAQTATTSANQYSFKDGASELTSHNVIYYRLKQVDMDGNFTYSAIKTVRLSSNTKTFVQVYPNPYMEKLNVNFNSDESGTAKIRLVNAAGQVASSQENIIGKGYNNFQVNNLNAIAPGIYTADLVINGKTIAHQKVIKQ